MNMLQRILEKFTSENQEAAAADIVTLNGQITMPAYSVQYLKMQ